MISLTNIVPFVEIPHGIDPVIADVMPLVMSIHDIAESFLGLYELMVARPGEFEADAVDVKIRQTVHAVAS